MERDDKISKDAIFEVLSSGRRRLLLFHLYRRGGEASLRNLAEDAAAEEFGEPLEEDQIKRIYIAFYQTHVPKLEDVGFVSYEPDEQHVTLEDEVIQIARVLPEESSQSHPWPVYYLVVALAGLGIAGMTYLDIGPLPDVFSTPILAAMLSIVLVGLSLLYYVARKQRQADLSFLEGIVGD